MKQTHTLRSPPISRQKPSNHRTGSESTYRDKRNEGGERRGSDAGEVEGVRCGGRRDFCLDGVLLYLRGKDLEESSEGGFVGLAIV